MGHAVEGVVAVFDLPASVLFHGQTMAGVTQGEALALHYFPKGILGGQFNQAVTVVILVAGLAAIGVFDGGAAAGFVVAVAGGVASAAVGVVAGGDRLQAT